MRLKLQIWKENPIWALTMPLINKLFSVRCTNELLYLMVRMKHWRLYVIGRCFHYGLGNLIRAQAHQRIILTPLGETLRVPRLPSYAKHHFTLWAPSAPPPICSFPQFFHGMMHLDMCTRANLAVITWFGSWFEAYKRFASPFETWEGKHHHQNPQY